MAVTKKRKVQPKRKKRRLAFELKPNGTSHMYMPRIMTREARWIGEITTETENQGDVYAVNADEAIQMDEFLRVIRGALPELVPHDAINCGIRIYLRC